MIGGDADVSGTARETMRFARRMKIDSVQFLILTPAPGTETYREMEEEGRLLTRDWKYYDGSYAVFEPKLMSAYELQAETLRAYLGFYSWASVICKLLSRDFFYSFLRLYARRVVIRSRRRLRVHKRKLKRQLTQGAMARLGTGSIKLPRPRTVLLADTVEGKHRLFFESFLKNLGVRVLPADIKDCLESTGKNIRCDLETRLADLKQKAGVLLVPVMDEVSALGRQGQTGLKTLLQQVEVSLPEGLKQLKLDFDPKKHSLYRSAMDLGLTLSGNLRRIRKAYRLALETSGL